MKQQNNIGLILAIIFSSTLLAGSLVFFGINMSSQKQNTPQNGDQLAKKIIYYFLTQSNLFDEQNLIYLLLDYIDFSILVPYDKQSCDITKYQKPVSTSYRIG